MSHQTPSIEAKLRDRTGTRYARRLRESGQLPAVIYGHGAPPQSVSVDEKEILTALHHGAHVFNVTIDGSTETCLVKDLQFGWLGDNVIHIDFTRVNLDEEVEVNVHLHFVGEPKDAKQPGAVLSHPLTELEVTCKVSDIPEEIKVDLSTMEGHTLTVGEIELPAGIATKVDPETTVSTITFQAEEEAEGEEVELEDGAAEPEVISEAKSDDDADKGEEG